MNTVLFKNWLIQKGHSTKVASDIVCRLKKIDLALIESLIRSSVDNEFNQDNCRKLLDCFSNNGKNSTMYLYQLKYLPIGKGSIHTYKLSLRKYIEFKKEYPSG